MIKNRWFATIYRLVIVICGIVALSISLFNNTGGAKMLVYFTIQSNILVLALFIVLLIKTIIQIMKEGKTGEVASVNLIFQIGVTFFICITGSVLAIFLSKGFKMEESESINIFMLSNILEHYVIPLMCVGDWILFVKHGTLKYKTTIIWLSYPFVYYIFCLIRAQFGPLRIDELGNKTYYPYPFLEVGTLGVGKAIIFVFLFLIGFVLLGMLIIFIDNKLKKINRK